MTFSTTYVALFLMVIILLIAYFRFTFFKLKDQLNEKNQVLVLTIKKEKTIEKEIKNYPNLIEEIQQRTQRKLAKINIDLITTDFTLKEICKFI
ncbi:hypothetical protein OD91_1309 [Lutibacter sp. Hel_I_33_5]|uniref:hypothetical protein n=1 Tax=Lutibacter sp. Hel_I_33_5 TaxID=1566289 RepID=UPI0011A37E59|nr:hypothetical protein [Lutibacter sp. Hel_I_33_5]TVZ56030.1 hypothetical protein OD91_1309 [Lutibacter sp. Hel_I_33_5]